MMAVLSHSNALVQGLQLICTGSIIIGTLYALLVAKVLDAKRCLETAPKEMLGS